MSPVADVEPKLDASGRHRSYGWGSVRPPFLQFLNSTKWLLPFMWIGHFSGRLASTGILPTIVTTISKRFAISNIQIGFLNGFNDIVAILIMGFVVYYGERGHKGHWVGYGLLLVALGALIFTMPQWTSKPWIGAGDTVNRSKTSETDYDICNPNSKYSPNCHHGDQTGRSSWTSGPFLLFLLGYGVMALGSIPMDLLGTTYLDENVTQKSSALYLTFLNLATVSAVLFGFLLGSTVLGIPGDGYRLSAAEVEKSKALYGWYGAWWIGYLIAACLACSAIVPLLGFPLELPSKEYRRSKDVDMAHKGDAGGATQKFGESWRDIPRGLKILAQNPAYVFMVLRSAFHMITLSGFVTFMPMYYQNAFNLSPQMAATYCGIGSIVPATIGGFVGAAIIKLRKFSVRGLLLIVIILLVLTSSGLFSLLAGCRNDHFAGANIYYNGSMKSDGSNIFQPDDKCNQDCFCGPDQGHLVCDLKTNIVYYSPCRAGCTDRSENGTFLNCKCVTSYKKPELGQTSILDPGICPKPPECRKRKFVVLVTFAAVALLSGINMAPIAQIVLRSVPFSLRTLGQGTQTVVVKLLGVIPGPLLFGMIMDKSCMVHDYKCGQAQRCLRYDIEGMSLSIVQLGFTVDLGCFILLIIALLLYQPVGKSSWMTLLIAKIRGKQDRKVHVAENMDMKQNGDLIEHF